MARPLRIEYDGALYHITSRGNEREAIFKDDGDRQLFLRILVQVTEHVHWIYHAYCLMNHYHLVIETPDGNLSKGMRREITLLDREPTHQKLNRTARVKT